MQQVKGNMALQSYINFNRFRDTIKVVEKEEGKGKKSQELKKGLFARREMPKAKKDKTPDKFEQLKTVLKYVEMIEDMYSGT